MDQKLLPEQTPPAQMAAPGEAALPSLPSHPDAMEAGADIAALVRSLKPDSPVRALALELMAGLEVPTHQPLLDALADVEPKRWRECAVAAWAAGHSANQDPVQQKTIMLRLCQILAKEEMQVRRPLLNRMLKRGMSAAPASLAIGALITGGFLAFSLSNGYQIEAGVRFLIAGALGSLFYGVLTSPIALGMLAGYDRQRIDKVRAAAAEALGNLKSPDSLDVLAVAAAGRGRELRTSAQDALLKVLPAITSEHYGLQLSETMRCLCQVLRDADAPLALAILSAMHHIGDATAIQTVTRLISRGQTAQVRQAAALLLPILLQRMEQENAPGVLLRASQSNATSPHTLLRATISHPEQDGQELLRAAAGSGETLTGVGED